MHHRSLISILSCMLVFVGAESAFGAVLPQSPFPPGPGAPFGMPGSPEGGMPPPPGFDRMPTQAEMEAMQKEFEQFLSSLSPEDIKELEKMGEEFIRNNPDEAAKLTGVPKEKLLAELPTKESSGEPPAVEQTEIPPEEGPLELDEEPSKPLKKSHQKIDESTQEATLTPSTAAEKNALRSAIGGLLFHLEALQNKAASSTIIHQELRSYLEEIRDLIFYLSLINTDEHNEQLTTGKFTSLVKTLIQFNEELAAREPFIPQPSLRMFDTPYDHLTLPFTATDKEIDKQFNQLAKKFKKAAVLKGLAKDASEADKKRALRIAQDSLELLTDDYKQLKDPKLRTLVDAQIRSEEEQFKEEAISIKNQIVSVIQIISAAIYQQKILDLLIEFLSEYEPLELQKRKDAERAEKAQLEEQKKRFKRKGARTPGGNFEPSLYTPGVTGPVPSYDGSPAGGFFGDTGISPSRGSSGWDKLFSPEGSTSQPASSKTAEEKDKDKKEFSVPKPSEAHQKAAKIDPRTPEQLIKDITRQFSKLNEEVSDEKTTKLFEKLEQEKKTALEKKQGQDDSASESKKGEANGSKKEPGKKDGEKEPSKKDGEKDKSKKSSLQELRSEKGGQKDDQQNNKKGSKKSSKKSDDKKSSRQESLKKEPKVKAEVITWRKKTLGLDTLASDLKKLLDKKSYEPRATENELILVKELFDSYREPSKPKAAPAAMAKRSENAPEDEEEEATIPPGLQTLKEKYTKFTEDAPKQFKTLFAKVEGLVTTIEKYMATLERFYQSPQIADTQSDLSEKKDERKKIAPPLRQTTEAPR